MAEVVAQGVKKDSFSVYDPKRIVLCDSDSRTVVNTNSAACGQPTKNFSNYLCVAEHDGRGGSFASGYFGSDKLVEKVVDRVRSMVDKSMWRSPVYIVSSIAGGSGSGIGALVAERLRLEFLSPSGELYYCAVGPRTCGDNPLQAYNCVMSLANMQEIVTGCVYFDNSLEFGPTTRSIPEVNRRIGSCLLSASTCDGLKLHAFCNRRYKYASGVFATSLEGMKQFLPSKGFVDSSRFPKGNVITCELTFCGTSAANIFTSPNLVFGDPVSWNPETAFYVSERENSTKLFSGVSAVVNWKYLPLTRFAAFRSKALRMAASGAYMHHLEPHGVTRECIADACDALLSNVILPYYSA